MPSGPAFARLVRGRIEAGNERLEMGQTLSSGVQLPRIAPHERIIEVARHLFCRDGIHATGIDRILAEANASKMTLYGRFGSKDALVRTVLEREGAEWRRDFFAAVLAAAPDAPGRLAAIVPALRSWFEGDRFYGCAFMNAAAEHAKGPEGEPWLRALTATHHAAIIAFLTGLATEAAYRNPALLARQLLLILDGTIAALMVTGQREVLDIATSTIEAVLRPSPSPSGRRSG